MTDDLRPEANEPKPDGPESVRPEMSGPANDALEAEEATKAAARDTLEQAGDEATGPSETGEAEEARTPAKLERLQKILAQAGIAS